MKHRLKGLLALVLSLTMLLSMVVTVSAETETELYPVSIDDVQLTSANISDYVGVSYNPNIATLTLDGFNGSSIYISAPMTINLVNSNTVNNTNGRGIDFATGGTLEITGSGSLTVTGTDTGIAALSSGGAIVISGGTVNANATGENGCAISATGTITIGGTDNPTVTVGCAVGLQANAVALNSNCTVIINSTSNAVAGCALDFGTNPYQWTDDSTATTLKPSPISYDGSSENPYPAYLKLVVGATGGSSRPIRIPSPLPDEVPTEVTAPNTFDSGIALSVAMTILAATGSAVLAKKRED